MSSRAPSPNATLFRTFRVEKGLKQHALAEQVGCSKRKIEDIEAGKNTSRALLAKCAAVFEVDVDLLIVRSGDSRPLDCTLTFVLRQTAYPSLESAWNAVRPILNEMEVAHRPVRIEYGSIRITIAARQESIPLFGLLLCEKKLKEVGVVWISSRSGDQFNNRQLSATTPARQARKKALESRAEAIRIVVASNPDKTPSEIAELLKSQGVEDVTAAYVSIVRYNIIAEKRGSSKAKRIVSPRSEHEASSRLPKQEPLNAALKFVEAAGGVDAAIEILARMVAARAQ